MKSKFFKKGVINMKIKVLLTAVLIIGLLGIGNLTFASAEKINKDTTSETSIQAPGEYKGTVVKTDEGYTLLAGEVTYMLKGEKLEDLVGETVNVRGQLVKTEKGDTIIVAKEELAQ
ncbi:MAG: hypothetical protein GY707_04050 [Desulfobacteraceae bacterium]|nr:hypothetical protein [Desulfobacteraceae bacterium]